MPRTTFAGHPTHPILIAFPIGTLSLGCALDFWNAVSPDERRDYAAGVAHTAGVITSVAAAVTGLLDYLDLPRERGMRRTGMVHGLLNVGMLGAAIANVVAHSNNKSRGVKAALSAVEMTGLMISQWYGAALIYETGVRVQGVDPISYSTEIKVPDDKAIHDAFAKVTGLEPSEDVA